MMVFSSSFSASDDDQPNNCRLVPPVPEAVVACGISVPAGIVVAAGISVPAGISVACGIAVASDGAVVGGATVGCAGLEHATINKNRTTSAVNPNSLLFMRFLLLPTLA